MSESLIGIVIAMNGLLIALTEMVLVYKIEGRRAATFYISIGTFLIGISYLVLNISATVNIVILGMLIVTVGEMLMFPFVNTFWVARSKDHNRGQYAAVFTISFAMAHVLAPTVGSQIVQHFNWDVLWYVVTAICIIAAVGFYSFGKYKIA